MTEELYDYELDGAEPKKKDHLFLWTIFILLLIGAACASWLGSAYIFGHPEEPRCYEILKKMKKIEAPRRFDVTAAPQGEFIAPQKLLDRYSAFKSLELRKENAELLRIFIRNYGETKRILPYVRGDFEVMDSAALKPGDAVSEGTVALLQAVNCPQIIVEHIFPCSDASADASLKLLSPGYPFGIEKTNDVTTILNVEKIPDGHLVITVIPLNYPRYALKGGAGTFACEPPAAINVAAGFPITKPDRLASIIERYNKMKASELPADEAPSNALAKGPEVVRLDTVPLGQKAPETGALPEPPVAVAQPVHPILPTPRPRTSIGDVAMNTRPALPVATPLPVMRDEPLRPPPSTPIAVMPPRPVVATPAPVAVAVPTPAPVASTPIPVAPAVPLKPFNAGNSPMVVQSNPAVVPPSETGGSWRMYAPGTQPRGRNLTPSDAVPFADQPMGGERMYLSGNFVVTAKGGNSAVLRPKGMEDAMRIVVDYPLSANPPGENTDISRGAERAFEIKSITRADDGKTINVYAREITRE